MTWCIIEQKVISTLSTCLGFHGSQRLRPKATGLFIAYMDPDDQTICRFSESSFFLPSSFVVEGWTLFIDRYV